jgi:hypothetical protein
MGSLCDCNSKILFDPSVILHVMHLNGSDGLKPKLASSSWIGITWKECKYIQVAWIISVESIVKHWTKTRVPQISVYGAVLLNQKNLGAAARSCVGIGWGYVSSRQGCDRWHAQRTTDGVEYLSSGAATWKYGMESETAEEMESAATAAAGDGNSDDRAAMSSVATATASRDGSVVVAVCPRRQWRDKRWNRWQQRRPAVASRN